MGGDLAPILDLSIQIMNDRPDVPLYRAAASLGHEAACARLTHVLAHLSTETSGHLVFVGEPIDICLGRMATVLGRFDQAADHFDIAAHLAEDFDGDWIRAMTLACRAQMFSERGDSGDTERAQRTAGDALAIAQARDYRGVAAMVADLGQAK